MSDIMKALQDIKAVPAQAVTRFMDDQEMYEKYVGEFPEEQTITRLRKAVEDKDYDAAEKAAHALKGITANLGFLRLTDAAVDMMMELRDGDIEEALKAYQDVEKQYEIHCAVIKAWRAQQ